MSTLRRNPHKHHKNMPTDVDASVGCLSGTLSQFLFHWLSHWLTPVIRKSLAVYHIAAPIQAVLNPRLPPRNNELVRHRQRQRTTGVSICSYAYRQMHHNYM